MVRIELTFSCAQDTRATGAPHPELLMTRVGFEPNLASLKDWQPHQKSNGPCLCAYVLRDPGSPGTIVGCGLEGARILVSWSSARR